MWNAPRACVSWLVLVALNVVALTTGVARGQVAGSEDEWSISLEASYLVGPVEGQTQTPNGGRPGTSSPGRPTLEEMGIDDTDAFDLSGTFSWDVHRIYAGGTWIGMSGDDTLEAELISRSVVFPAGTAVEGTVDHTWYRLGYQRPIALNESWTIAPGGGIAFWRFDWGVEGGGQAMDRGYTKTAAQLGVDARSRMNATFSVSGGVLSSIPIEHTPFILAADVTAEWWLMQQSQWQAAAKVGVAYQMIRYEDDQTMPNDIELDLGPMLVIGVEVRF